jgi:predicted alpha/beta hydrolase
MWGLWHVLMPAVTRVYGYFPARKFGLPADLPAGVAFDWAARRRPGFDASYRLADGTPDHHRIAELVAGFRALKVGALAVTLADDPFTTPLGTARLLALFSGCRFQQCRIDPSKLGLPKIGHFGFFRSFSGEMLWPTVGDWLDTEAVEEIVAKQSR